MQKLLEDLSSPQQRSLVIAALCPGAVTLASDPNGHLVILYCLKNFSFEYNKVTANSSLYQMLLNVDETYAFIYCFLFVAICWVTKMLVETYICLMSC